MPKDPGKLYRLAENQLHWGLEGRIVTRDMIPYDDLCLFDIITDDEYHYEVKLDPGAAYQGVYRFETDREVRTIMQNITGHSWPSILVDLERGERDFIFDTHLGHFVFHVRIIKKLL